MQLRSVIIRPWTCEDVRLTLNCENHGIESDAYKQ